MPGEIDVQLTATPMYSIASVSTEEASPELVSVAVRRKAASEGKAMSDGSFPIRNVADLQRAIQAYGRAKDKVRAKRFIMKRARELKRPDLIPADWRQTPASVLATIQFTELDLLEPAPEPACEFSDPDTEFVKSPGPCSLDRSAKHNWVENVGGLPNYICQVARAVARGGKSLDSAIPIAINTIKRWAAGAGDVSPAVRARAVAALAEWEAKKARAKANGVDAATFELTEDDIELVDLLVDFAGTPNVPNHGNTSGARTKALPSGERPKDKKAVSGTGNSRKRGPYRSSGRKVYRNKRQVILRLDGKADGRSLRTNFKRFAPHAPSGLGGQFAPLGRGVKATHKKYGTEHSLEENMPAELAFVPFNVAAVVKQVNADIGKMTDKQLTTAASVLAKAPANAPGVSAARAKVSGAIQNRKLGTKKAAPAPHKAAAAVETEELAAGDFVVVTSGTFAGKTAEVLGRAPKDEQVMVRVDGRIGTVDRAACEQKPVAVTASGAAVWDDTEFSYFWDEEHDHTFRVSEAESTVQIFDGTLMDWAGTDLTVEEVKALPQVDDCDSLEALVGGGELSVVEEAPPAVKEIPAVAEPSALAAATQEAAADDVVSPEGAGEGGGGKFRIPLLIPVETWSGDRRRFSKDSLEVKETPFPLLWQRMTDEGHKQSVIVGRVDKAELLENGSVGNLEGVFDTHADAVEAARQVKGRFVTTVSGDVDKFDHELAQNDDGKESIEIKHGRVVACTIVAKPAFQEAVIEYVPGDGEEAMVASAAPGAGPLHPSQAWFQAPAMTEPYMFTVDDDGRCHGLIAEWNSSHSGNPAWKPPKNFSGYAYFNRKPVRTAEGTDVRTGQLTLTGGHPELSLDPDAVVRHYDDTRSAVADVVVGENEFGIWAAGAMRPDVSPEQIRAFRASEPSGDWRAKNGDLELLAVCMVNTAGFPVMPRAMVASSGVVTALVAAGMSTHVRKMDLQAQVEQLSTTVATLQGELSDRLAALEADIEARRRSELQAAIEALRA